MTALSAMWWLCAFGMRSAALGAAAVALTAAGMEMFLVQRSVNAMAVGLAALASKTCGRPLWWGPAAYGLVVVGLGSESMRSVALFWGIGLLLECGSRLLPRARGI